MLDKSPESGNGRSFEDPDAEDNAGKHATKQREGPYNTEERGGKGKVILSWSIRRHSEIGTR